MRRSILVAVGLSCAVVMGGVLREARLSATSQQAGGAAGDSARHELEPYRRARWRLAPQQLHRVMLKVSHLALRHEASDSQAPWMRGPDWRPDRPAPRSRAAAIARAFELAERAQRAPERFAELARAHSEDEVSAPWGGALGLVRAAQLPSEFLDAVADLKPGQVSRPFETAYGIHIVKLETAPPEQQLAATRILIGYRPSSLAIVRPGHEAARSRTEAWRLAAEVLRQARAPGADFEALVARYSDSIDAEQHGDVGVWSTHEVARAPLVVEALSRVAIGEVAEPVDTSEGIQILKRAPVTARERFAMDYVLVAPLGRSNAAMQEQMNEVVAAVTAEPARFDTFRKELCCNVPMTWARGRGPSSKIERALHGSTIGAIVPEPIETPGGIYLVKKRELPTLQSPLPILALPAPEMPDLDAILQNVDGVQLARQLQLVAKHLTSLPLPTAKLDRLGELVKTVARALPSATPNERSAVLRDFWQDAAAFLSPQEVQLLRHSITAFTKAYLMNL
jgi:hypothetical protein